MQRIEPAAAQPHSDTVSRELSQVQAQHSPATSSEKRPTEGPQDETGSIASRVGNVDQIESAPPPLVGQQEPQTETWEVFSEAQTLAPARPEQNLRFAHVELIAAPPEKKVQADHTEAKSSRVEETILVDRSIKKLQIANDESTTHAANEFAPLNPLAETPKAGDAERSCADAIESNVAVASQESKLQGLAPGVAEEVALVAIAGQKLNIGIGECILANATKPVPFAPTPPVSEEKVETGNGHAIVADTKEHPPVVPPDEKPQVDSVEALWSGAEQAKQIDPASPEQTLQTASGEIAGQLAEKTELIETVSNGPKENTSDPRGLGRKENLSITDWSKDQSQFTHLPPLPSGWIRVRSKTTGSIYYCCVATGETTYDEPLTSPHGNHVPQDLALPPGWRNTRSRSTGDPHNRKYGFQSQHPAKSLPEMLEDLDALDNIDIQARSQLLWEYFPPEARLSLTSSGAKNLIFFRAHMCRARDMCRKGRRCTFAHHRNELLSCSAAQHLRAAADVMLALRADLGGRPPPPPLAALPPPLPSAEIGQSADEEPTALCTVTHVAIDAKEAFAGEDKHWICIWGRLEVGQVVRALRAVERQPSGWSGGFLVPIDVGSSITVLHIEDDHFWGERTGSQGWVHVSVVIDA